MIHLWFTFLNVAHAGPGGRYFCSFRLSAAQARCVQELHRRAAAFIASVGNLTLGGEGKLRAILRLASDARRTATVSMR